VERGAELVITTAGMSVDPDDVTRLGVAEAGARIISYGAPVLPGAMFLYAELYEPGRTVPVLGVPACALFHQTTILDLVLPRVLAGERLDPDRLAELAYGGYCRDCAEGCRYPACGFGKA
jgi:molybdopterin biosynthesis enzyme